MGTVTKAESSKSEDGYLSLRIGDRMEMLPCAETDPTKAILSAIPGKGNRPHFGFESKVAQRGDVNACQVGHPQGFGAAGVLDSTSRSRIPRTPEMTGSCVAAVAIL